MTKDSSRIQTNQTAPAPSTHKEAAHPLTKSAYRIKAVAIRTIADAISYQGSKATSLKDRAQQK